MESKDSKRSRFRVVTESDNIFKSGNRQDMEFIVRSVHKSL